jgi:hypothetical protein
MLSRRKLLSGAISSAAYLGTAGVVASSGKTAGFIPIPRQRPAKDANIQDIAKANKQSGSLSPAKRIAAARKILAAQSKEPPPPNAVYMESAKAAWEFFERYRRSYAGMCPGTAYWSDGRLQGYPIVTVWDVASFINGYCSAYLLGLIDKAELSRMAEHVIGELWSTSFRFGDASLPHVDMVIGGPQQAKQSFDAADAGRLLISLRMLDNFTDGKTGIAALVASWDFNAVIKEGRPHNVENGKLKKFSRNSYSHYVSHGYVMWGHDAERLYEFSNSYFNEDVQARLLKQVARRGRIATEPNATELIEIGSSPAVDFICDMLLAAQISRHADKGILTCASEGLLDQAPWFTYQACQFNLQGEDQWVIDTSSHENSELVKAKGDDLRTISSKGCFLWSAVRPGAYSNKLLDCVRQHGRTKGLGFASNIYEKTLRATTCSDVNCNGIILEALAYIVSGRVPLMELSERHRLIGISL